MSGVTGRPLRKGEMSRIVDGVVNATYPFQFNPTEFRRAHNANYVFSSSPGSPLPIALFKSIQGADITFQLMLDSIQDFRTGTNQRENRSLGVGTMAQQAELESYVQPDLDSFLGSGALPGSSTLGNFVSPPEVRLTIGPRTWNVVSTTISFTDLMFDRELLPIRTIADVSMQAVFVDDAELAAHLLELSRLRALTTVNTAPRGDIVVEIGEVTIL